MYGLVNFENIRSFCYTNAHLVERPKAMVLELPGLNGTAMTERDSRDAVVYAEHGVLYVFCYTNPWAWMNPQTVALCDEIEDALFAHYSLPDDFPVVVAGGSMGGQQCFIYALRSKHTPVAAVANCPVCDMVYHVNERPDLPRTIYSAVSAMPGTFEEAVRAISPLHVAEEMPKIPYRIFHADSDPAVSMEHHSVPYTEKMRSLGADIELQVIHGSGHCDPGAEGAYRLFKTKLDFALGK